MDQAIIGTVLVGFLIAAAVTDVREHKILNWTTYPGMIAGPILNAVFRGGPGLYDSAAGFLTCGIVMVVCFVLFNVGGGDVKLIAMMGSFLGFENGIEAMLWTFIIGSAIGIVMLIARFGVLHLVKKLFEHLRIVWRAKGWVAPTEEERKPLQRWLFLAPAGLIAAGIVLGKPWLREWGFLY